MTVVEIEGPASMDAIIGRRGKARTMVARLLI